MTVSNTIQKTKLLAFFTLLALFTKINSFEFVCMKESEAKSETDWWKVYKKKTGDVTHLNKKNGTKILESKGYDAYEYNIKTEDSYKKVKKVIMFGEDFNRRMNRYRMAAKVESSQEAYLKENPDGRHFVEQLFDIRCVTDCEGEIFSVFKVNLQNDLHLLSYTHDQEYRAFFDLFENRLKIYRLILEDLKILYQYDLTACVVNPFTVFLEKTKDGYNPVLGQTEFFQESKSCEAPFKNFSPPEIFFGNRFLDGRDQNKVNVFNVGYMILFMESYLFSSNFQSSDITDQPSEAFKSVNLTDQIEQITDCEGTADCFDIFEILKILMKLRLGDMEFERNYQIEKSALTVYEKEGKYDKFLDNIKVIGKILQAEKKSFQKYDENITVKVSGMIMSSQKKASDVFMGFYNDLLKLSYKMMKKNKDRLTYDKAIEEISNIETKYAEFLEKVNAAQEERRLIRLV